MDERGQPDALGLTRRSFVRKGLVGGAVLALGGGAAIGLRKTLVRVAPKGALAVFSPEEHAIFTAIAERVVSVPQEAPGVASLDVAGRADAAMALALPSVQKEFRQLLRLFENGLTGLATGTGLSPFTVSSAKAQDARLEAWASSRVALFRTGYQAMKRLAAACYYSAPEAWSTLGYPGPPELPDVGPAAPAVPAALRGA